MSDHKHRGPLPTMNKLKTLAHNLRSTEAAEIAEAALVLPLVFMFLLGVIWFGRAFNIYSTIQQAAQQGALAAARPTCATCTAGSPPAAVDTAVAAVMQASSIPPSQIIAGTSFGAMRTVPNLQDHRLPAGRAEFLSGGQPPYRGLPVANSAHSYSVTNLRHGRNVSIPVPVLSSLHFSEHEHHYPDRSGAD